MSKIYQLEVVGRVWKFNLFNLAVYGSGSAGETDLKKIEDSEVSNVLAIFYKKLFFFHLFPQKSYYMFIVEINEKIVTDDVSIERIKYNYK